MRTKEPDGKRITLLKIIDPFTNEIKYLTYNEEERFKNDKRGAAYLYEAKGGSWHAVAGYKEGELTEWPVENDSEQERELIQKTEQEINFPPTLSAKDRELVMEQCENQYATTKEQIEGFANAYKIAKGYSVVHIMEGSGNWDFLPESERSKRFWVINGDEILRFISILAQYVESRNEKGYRKTPVSFENGNTALPAEQIERAMDNFTEAYVEGRLTPDEAYEEFERIHPFEDGNGRVGDLLWKMAMVRDTGKWPEKLPPDVFGEKEPQFLSMAEQRRHEYLKSQI